MKNEFLFKTTTLTQTDLLSLLLLSYLLLVPASVEAQDIVRLQAEQVASFQAMQAGQGAVADSNYVYAIVNSAIGRYDRQTFEQSGQWSLPRSGPIQHINSCITDEEKNQLLCANSNFPEVPMASSIEIFNTQNMRHVNSHSLGLTDGSLVWFDRLGDDWIAGFSHYDDKGGLPFKDHRYTRIVRYDTSWKEKGGWMLPNSVLERLAPIAHQAAVWDQIAYYT